MPDRPELIEGLAESVYRSHALLAGMQLDVFTALANGPKDVEELATSLGVVAHKLGPLLYLLADTGLLTAENGRFSNAREADRYLVRHSASYIGDRHLLWSELWEASLKSADTIRTGVPAGRHDFTRMSVEDQVAYFAGLHPRAVETGRAFAKSVDLSPYRSILDLGCGSAGFAIGIAETFEGRLCVADLPAILPLTERFLDESGSRDRIDILPIDLMNVECADRFDVVIVKNCLQVMSPDAASAATGNVAKLIEPGGHLYIMGDILEDSRRSPRDTVALNLALINLYDHGQAYTLSEYTTWLTSAGYTDIVALSDEVIRATLP